jgi:hypothetical protein
VKAEVKEKKEGVNVSEKLQGVLKTIEQLTEELAKEKGIVIDREDFDKKMAEHQKLSQTASAGMFKGGLANHEPKTIKRHTYLVEPSYYFQNLQKVFLKLIVSLFYLSTMLVRRMMAPYQQKF